MDKQIDAISNLLRCVKPSIEENQWRIAMQRTADTLTTITWFSHPEIINLALVTLLAGCDNRHSTISNLTVDMHTLQSNVMLSDGTVHNILKDGHNYQKHSNHAWNIGQLVWTFSQSIPPSDEHSTGNDCYQSLAHVLEWVGGSLSIDLQTEKGGVDFHLIIPFRSVVDDQQEGTKQCRIDAVYNDTGATKYRSVASPLTSSSSTFSSSSSIVLPCNSGEIIVREHDNLYKSALSIVTNLMNKMLPTSLTDTTKIHPTIE